MDLGGLVFGPQWFGIQTSVVWCVDFSGLVFRPRRSDVLTSLLWCSGFGFLALGPQCFVFGPGVLPCHSDVLTSLVWCSGGPCAWTSMFQYLGGRVFDPCVVW